jgi:hypothetical protein
MIFLTYEFVGFALVFFSFYYLASHPKLRLAVLVVGGLVFQFHYGGWASLVPVAALAGVTFLAARVGRRQVVTAAIVVCVATLIVYKYTAFIAIDAIGALLPNLRSRSVVPCNQYFQPPFPLVSAFSHSNLSII